jgi:hypothetical protein
VRTFSPCWQTPWILAIALSTAHFDAPCIWIHDTWVKHQSRHTVGHCSRAAILLKAIVQELVQRAEQFGTAPISWQDIHGEPVAFSSVEEQHKFRAAVCARCYPASCWNGTSAAADYCGAAPWSVLSLSGRRPGAHCRHRRSSLECGDDADAADAALQHPRAGEG